MFPNAFMHHTLEKNKITIFFGSHNKKANNSKKKSVDVTDYSNTQTPLICLLQEKFIHPIVLIIIAFNGCSRDNLARKQKKKNRRKHERKFLNNRQLSHPLPNQKNEGKKKSSHVFF